jgi:PAS domain S-box-containing protein
VLHVDDDPDLGEVTAQFLQQESDAIDVVTETSVSAGLDRLATERIDCVVSDYEMPECDGLTFLRQVRDKHDDIPFILYTGKGSEEIASDAISAGVTDYLQKETGTKQYTVLAHRIENVVEQYRSQHAAEATERKLSQLAEHTDDILFMFDGDWEELLFINSAYEEIWGQSIPELRDDPASFLEFVHPDDRDIAEQSLQRLQQGEPDTVEYRVVTDDGDQRWVHGETKPIFDDDGEVTRIPGFVRDITERKEREQELRRAERRFEAMFNDPNILVGLIDIDGSVIDINETALDYIDTELAAITGEPFWETPWFGGNETVQQEVREWIDRAADGEYVEFEVDLAEAVGEPLVVSGVFRPVRDEDGKVVSLLISDRDITERKERTRELQQYEAYLEESSDIITVLDETGTITYQSPAAERILGYEQDELIGRDGFDFIHPDDVAEVSEMFTDLVAEPGATVTVECRFKTGDDWRWLEIRATNRLAHDAINGVVANSRDITAEKQQRRRYKAIFNHTYQFTGLLEPDGTLIEANDTALAFGGLDREDVIGQKMWEAYWFQHSADTREQAQAAISRAAEGEFVREELPVQGADREAIIDFSVRPVTDDQGNVTLLIPEGRDITELKEREQALQRERDRLDEFAGVVSHDLRNPLNVAKGRIELMRDECDSEHLDAIERAIDRIERITDDVLWLAREGRDIGAMDAVVMGETIDAAWEIVADRADQAELHYADAELSTASIEADSNRLRQVLENLFSNAIEHAGPDVTVTVGTTDDGFYVADDGPGIPEDKRDSVFTAGYSTSDDGTGFGLRIVEQVADARGWDVHVTDASDGGARFVLTGVEFIDW